MKIEQLNIGDTILIGWENGDETIDIIKSIDYVVRLTYDFWCYPELIIQILK
jgi:hypothetical protein